MHATLHTPSNLLHVLKVIGPSPCRATDSTQPLPQKLGRGWVDVKLQKASPLQLLSKT